MNGTLIEALGDRRIVFLDTSPIIYFIQEDQKYLHLVDPLFQAIGEGRLEGYSSIITLVEVLTKPLKENRKELAGQYREVLNKASNFVMFSVDERTAERAAQLRAAHGLKTPDAIQAATALLNGAEAFVTNDGDLRRVNGLHVLKLSEFGAQGLPDPH